ncbi:CHAP domain-containing protein [Bifidobacterium eulemuris]|uniref:CHAP domain-containing protein n=1 Tax=Bifidobacterium eulemuris TaxID=1765219 RepID=A0A7L9SS44_9BIFI|nr:CHAP domain-containing protein [Bifidobacterium eulemuris]QOL35405.1 CHAP domain-containing protein [Bifidobacterium lemurum]
MSAKLSHGATGVTSSVWAGAADRTDTADIIGHDTASVTAGAGSKTANTLRHGVGAAAAHARRRLNSGRPTKIIEANASDRIAARAAKGGASGKIAALRSTGKTLAGGVGRVGRAGSARLKDLDTRLMQADTDDASRIATATRSAAYRASGKATSSVKSMWRHRKAPVRAARAGADVARAGARAAVAAANFVRGVAVRTVSAIASAAASISMPLIPIAASVLAVVMLVVSVAGLFAGTGQAGVKNVPSEYVSDVQRAGSICAAITPAAIAAQIEAESGWDPQAQSPAGAQGIAQFMPSTWAAHGLDGDGDGTADVWNPHDAIWSQGNYMCSIVTQVEGLKRTGAVSGDTLSLALAAYNAGLGAVVQHGGIPPYTETRNYVSKITGLISKYQGDATFDDSSGQTGQLSPSLTVSAAGYVSTAGIDLSPGSTYAWGQCTWWAAIRRAQIGKAVDPYMGNGGDWGSKAIALGYSVGSSPRPGDAICFHRGVLGADATYGHIGIVEAVYDDGSILISEANARGVGVVSTRTITASQLAAAGTGIQFIH